MYGIIDFSRINTDPGAKSAFAPPVGWQGDYRQYMRQSWKTNPGFRQHVAVVARMLAQGREIVFYGRFADEARRIAEAASKNEKVITLWPDLEFPPTESADDPSGS